MNSKRILLAGASGYLGGFIAQSLLQQHYSTTVVVRNSKKVKHLELQANQLIQAELTKSEELEGCCEKIDVVISTVGITKQKDGLSYMDVDFQANMNLLNEAKKSAVTKFIYVSVLNGEHLKSLKICEAKERFVEELKKSGLEYCVIRPNGFFSDLEEFFNMAQKGRVFLFGNGHLKSNPIHGIDLAKVCVQSITSDEKVIKVGGPQILTQNEIANIAFGALHKTVKITYIPEWVRKFVLAIGKSILPTKTFGPIEFFMTVLAMEMVAPKYGSHTVEAHFNSLSKK